MAYTPVHDPWINGEHDADDDAFNQIEEGIETAHQLAAAAQATADQALGLGGTYIRQDLVDAKGDLLVAAGADTVTRLGVGSADQTIFPDASAPGGIAWGSITGSRISGYPSDATKFLRGDGTWAQPSGGIAPTFIGAWGFTSAAINPTTANLAYLSPLPNIIAATTITRVVFGIQVQNGNYDVGIYYSDDESTYTRLVSKGSTSVPSAGFAYATVASTTITPVVGRRWYVATAFSGTGSIYARPAMPFSVTKTSSFPLPASLSSMSAAAVTDFQPAVMVGV